MNSLLTGIQPENNFPLSDIPCANVSLLSVILCNQDLLKQIHDEVERRARQYSLGHNAIKIAFDKISENKAATKAVTLGVVIYESVSGLVKPAPIDIDEEQVLIISSFPANPADTIVDLCHEGAKNFTSTMPNINEVVDEVASRLDGSKYYATVGAAVAWMLELQTIDGLPKYDKT